MELDLWPAFVSRGDVQALAPGQRMFLIELGTISANIEDLEIPEGFVPEGALAYMRWDSETMTSYLAEFEARRWITSLDEPRGWRIEPVPDADRAWEGLDIAARPPPPPRRVDGDHDDDGRACLVIVAVVVVIARGGGCFESHQDARAIAVGGVRRRAPGIRRRSGVGRAPVIRRRMRRIARRRR